MTASNPTPVLCASLAATIPSDESRHRFEHRRYKHPVTMVACLRRCDHRILSEICDIHLLMFHSGHVRADDSNPMLQCKHSLWQQLSSAVNILSMICQQIQVAISSLTYSYSGLDSDDSLDSVGQKSPQNTLPREHLEG